MDHVFSESSPRFGRSLPFLAASFALAFCLQTLAHEGGHYLAGILAGATGGSMALHPFFNSRVVFAREPGLAGQVITGLAGPGLDLLLASLLSLVALRSRRPLLFPLLAWGALALFGEGLGMIASLASFAGQEGPRYYEDITQLLRLGLPAWPLLALAILLTLAGLLLMALIAPLAGLSPSDSFPRRLAAFLAFLPLYFLVALLAILAFSPARDGLGMRLGQFAIALPAAFLLALAMGPLAALAARLRLSLPVRLPGRRDLAAVLLAAFAALGGLLLTGGTRG